MLMELRARVVGVERCFSQVELRLSIALRR